MNRQQPTSLDNLTTESSNPASANIDTLEAIDIVDVINRQDAMIADAVAKERQSIAAAIELVAGSLRSGGRLIYIGAGTSGRLGVLDASECPPTFNTPPEWVVGLIAGGPTALTRAIEGAEDHPEVGQQDLQSIDLNAKDTVVGIATSGRTPYVIGALQYAREIGAGTVGFSCNQTCELSAHCDVMIAPVVGPEVVTGSTRMKAGTATKMVLNMLTTGAMIRLGKTYGNLMVDLRATNEKLKHRSRRLVTQFTDLDLDEAQTLLDSAGGELKTAIVMQRRNVTADQARNILSEHDGHLRAALGDDTSTGS
ncbi:N-acetylmuramic acid 6-phosphate etherase [Rubripirellula lacrimiformis]|uniref:N-acetylmuramic acid 6-phosphate etherase n=1 Tax=Rubripirellula lacrimiformis TaxID=1930273 RepID=A0A517N3Y8_9BACT|nr:N-acetylmuramic acid 6-phosphate etherase [Rubripirellula lacrimiformis]QDT01857.1 N-acetylmuramic acid 6-phosphate etherase [Rubripirellula lacrimiformis]